MKTIKLLLLAILFTSCSADSIDDSCNCNKLSYDIEQYPITLPNGVVVMTTETVLLSSEPVVCQPEGRFQINDGNRYYIIECN